MSERNVEIHRHCVEAFNARDPEALTVHVDPNVEYYPVLAAIGGVSVYRGHEGLRSWFRDFDEVWGSEIRAEPQMYFAIGDQTILDYVLQGRGKQSGAEVTMQLTQVATWRKRLCVHLKVYTNRNEALGDLGVSPGELDPIAP